MLKQLIQDYRTYILKQKKLSDNDYHILLKVFDQIQAFQAHLEITENKSQQNRVLINIQPDKSLEIYSDQPCVVYSNLETPSQNFIKNISKSISFIGDDLINELIKN
ncbi:MAG: hypothetical protein CMP22_07565 [Rickettsiales bacterium]|nr:hypothetical protein [Rickettsiales bacterium]|tara:strand:+ start:530 stop:850 length:321 start_codon:yes stop_codon:yes gene_type:complete